MTAILRKENEYNTAHDVLKEVVGLILMAAAEVRVSDYPEGKTILSALESKAIKSMPVDNDAHVEALVKRLRKMVEEKEAELEEDLSNDEDEDNVKHVSGIKFNGPIAEA